MLSVPYSQSFEYSQNILPPYKNTKAHVLNPANLETKRKKIYFRAWHRGIREADLLLGGFADQWIERLDDGALERFETLLETPDPVLFDWICGRADIPDDARNDVLEMLLEFHKNASRQRIQQR